MLRSVVPHQQRTRREHQLASLQSRRAVEHTLRLKVAGTSGVSYTSGLLVSCFPNIDRTGCIRNGHFDTASAMPATLAMSGKFAYFDAIPVAWGPPWFEGTRASNISNVAYGSFNFSRDDSNSSTTSS